jgi:cell division protein FtsZ
MGMGEARGEDRAELAVNMAISSPLLEDISLAGARGVLLNVTVHPETFTLYETQIITSTILKEAHPEAKVFYGIVFDESMEDLLRVTVIGTGIERIGEKVKDDKIMSLEEGRKRKEEKLRRIVDNELIDDILDIPTFLRRSAD